MINFKSDYTDVCLHISRNMHMDWHLCCEAIKICSMKIKRKIKNVQFVVNEDRDENNSSSIYFKQSSFI